MGGVDEVTGGGQVAESSWSLLELGLSIGASAAAIVAALWASWKLAVRIWDATVGRRRAQTAILDQLACTTSQAFVENLLGLPRFVLGDECLYRLPGAWVTIRFKDAAVYMLSFTITDPRMWYRTNRITLETIDVRLGRDTFADVRSPGHIGEHSWALPRECGYFRHFHFGGAGGGHQHFWLSFNSVGAGHFEANGPYASGTCGDFGDSPPDPSKITVNTIAILSPVGSAEDDVGSREIFGPHSQTLNLVPAEQHTRRRWFHV